MSKWVGIHQRQNRVKMKTQTACVGYMFPVETNPYYLYMDLICGSGLVIKIYMHLTYTDIENNCGIMHQYSFVQALLYGLYDYYFPNFYRYLYHELFWLWLMCLMTDQLSCTTEFVYGVSVCVFIHGVPGWYVLTATLGMPRMWEMVRRSKGLCSHAPDGRSRFSDWLVPGGRSAVGVLSVFWRKVEGQLPPELSFPPLARRGSSSSDESYKVKTEPFFQEFSMEKNRNPMREM